jgi:hypothetical protein
MAVYPWLIWVQSPGKRSHYGDYLQAGRPRSRSSSSGKVKNFLFSTSSRPALGFIQPPIQWVPGDLSPGEKRPEREADHSPPISAEVKKVDLYIHSFIRLHGIVLNWLSTGTALPFSSLQSEYKLDRNSSLLFYLLCLLFMSQILYPRFLYSTNCGHKTIKY